ARLRLRPVGDLRAAPRARPRGACLGADRKQDSEARALAGLGVDLEPPIHALDELAADVEAQPAAADAAGLLRIEPVELLEDPLLLRARDPEPLVGHFDQALTVGRLEPNLDVAAVWRVLDRVVHEIHEHLPELVDVAENRLRALLPHPQRNAVREVQLRG